MRAFCSFAIALVSIGLSAAQQVGNNTTLPIVDLGYELHQAISYNVSYLFSLRAPMRYIHRLIESFDSTGGH